MAVCLFSLEAEAGVDKGGGRQGAPVAHHLVRMLHSH